jgi:beta-galactosidase/beta-glucuronidase
VQAADWQPAKGPLMTRWAKDVSPERVHPEYPRPQLAREVDESERTVGLHAIVGQASSLPKVGRPDPRPLSDRSALSGVMKRVSPTDKLWYRRTFKAPDLKDGRSLLLHFGAVDWDCEVFINGKIVGDHIGGYDPFTIEITDALGKSKAEQELVVSVTDPSDANWQPRGKQVREPKGIWYTPTTGIWQTVWLEEVPTFYISELRVIPDVDAGAVRVKVEWPPRRGLGGSVQLDAIVSDGDREVTRATAKDFEVTIPLQKPKLWSPDSPFLYQLEVRFMGDTVRSYFGMRNIALGKDDRASRG